MAGVHSHGSRFQVGCSKKVCFSKGTMSAGQAELDSVPVAWKFLHALCLFCFTTLPQKGLIIISFDGSI